MYAGRAVEGRYLELFDHPRHPYTHGLMASIPRLEDVPKSLPKTIRGQVPPCTMPAGAASPTVAPRTDLRGDDSGDRAAERRRAAACHHWKRSHMSILLSVRG